MKIRFTNAQKRKKNKINEIQTIKHVEAEATSRRNDIQHARLRLIACIRFVCRPTLSRFVSFFFFLSFVFHCFVLSLIVGFVYIDSNCDDSIRRFFFFSSLWCSLRSLTYLQQNLVNCILINSFLRHSLSSRRSLDRICFFKSDEKAKNKNIENKNIEKKCNVWCPCWFSLSILSQFSIDDFFCTNNSINRRRSFRRKFNKDKEKLIENKKTKKKSSKNCEKKNK